MVLLEKLLTIKSGTHGCRFIIIDVEFILFYSALYIYNCIEMMKMMITSKTISINTDNSPITTLRQAALNTLIEKSPLVVQAIRMT